MADQTPKHDHKVDRDLEQTFPASDPPSSSPPPGTRKAEQAEKAVREKDPHGVGPAQDAKDHEPKGSPTSARHDTETATHRDR